MNLLDLILVRLELGQYSIMYTSQGNGCKNCSQGDTSMKLPTNVHKDLLYNFRAGVTEISVLHSNGC